MAVKSAPDLLRAALRAGIEIGWEADGMVYAQVTDQTDETQCEVFNELMHSDYAPDVLQGLYYAGDYTRLQ